LAGAIIDSREGGSKEAILVSLAVILMGLLLLGLSDTVISTADTSVSDNEVTSSEGNKASATASIRITMTGVLDE